ncbi:tricarboxylate transporter, partial [Candida albicans P57055]
VDPLKSFIAGGTAGAVEGIITYPFEFAKTRLQLISKSSTAGIFPLVLTYNVAKTQGVSSLYVGCPAFVVGNTYEYNEVLINRTQVRNPDYRPPTPIRVENELVDY